MNKQKIKEHYKEHKSEIDSRLDDFESLRDSSEKRKFKELVFVILTSQSSAEDCWEATNQLESKNLLLSDNKTAISEVLEKHGVSYPKDKTDYIVENRKILSQPTLQNPKSCLKISERIKKDSLDDTRLWMAENLKGISWKGSSHFLRNIGYGNSFAIISTHIITFLHEIGLLESPKTPNSREEYIEMEEKIKQISKELDIDIKALDLVLWSMKTGKIFK